MFALTRADNLIGSYVDLRQDVGPTIDIRKLFMRKLNHYYNWLLKTHFLKILWLRPIEKVF